MCLAIPCKIVKIEDTMAVIDVGGVKSEVSLLLVDEPGVGEYVVVHSGFAIQKIDEKEALESIETLRKIASIACEEEVES